MYQAVFAGSGKSTRHECDMRMLHLSIAPVDTDDYALRSGCAPDLIFAPVKLPAHLQWQSHPMPVQVIDKAVRLMRVVAKLGPISLTSLSVESGIPLPTVSRIAQSLLENGILKRSDDKRYELGARLLPLAMPLEPFRRSLHIAHPFIEEFTRRTKEDCPSSDNLRQMAV